MLPLASHGYVSVSYLPIPRFCICIISTTTAIKELFTFKLVFGVQKSYKQLGSWSDTFISLLLRADITQFFSCSIHSEKHCNLPNRVAACFGPHCTALHCYTKMRGWMTTYICLRWKTLTNIFQTSTNTLTSNI